ncbi:MAG: glycosyltransferase family 2 protein [Sediminibacterium sp.]|nr:glycosyltransferase family 2 protein [Sediminibacterium sp.]
MADAIVDELVSRISDSVQRISEKYEIVLVEDGSSDQSWKKIKSNCYKDSRIKGVRLSRNFGQHCAITAGLKIATGNCVVVLDCDLQDDPIYIADLVKRHKEGFDVVYTRRKKRRFGLIKNLFTRLFYKIYNYLVSDVFAKGTDLVGGYSLISRKVVNAYLEVGDYRRQYLMIIKWLGFRHSFIEIEHAERHSGRSSYSVKKLIQHGIDGITSHSVKLLNLMTYFGFLLSSLSFIAGITLIISYLYTPFQAGWTSIFVLILFIGGIIISCVGVCGIYIGRIFEQAKGRPMYLIDETINVEH